jgi:hypothetical protein
VERAEVGVEGERLLPVPALVQTGGVRICSGYEVPGGVRPVGQLGCLGDDAGGFQDGQEADGFVRVRAAEQEDVAAAGSDGEQAQWFAEAADADGGVPAGDGGERIVRLVEEGEVVVAAAWT